jgi:hypothetical protein
MSQRESNRAERRAVIAVCVLVIVGVIALSIWSRSWFGIIAYAVFVAIPSAFYLLRSRSLGDSEIQDRMMRAKDDPNEMARWVP